MPKTDYVDEVMKKFDKLTYKLNIDTGLPILRTFIRGILEKLEAEKNEVIDQLVDEREVLGRALDNQQTEYENKIQRR